MTYFRQYFPLFIFLLVSLFSPLLAQERLDLGLHDCVQRALTHSSALKKAALDKTALGYQAKEAKQLLYPQVSSFIDLAASPLLPTQIFEAKPFGLSDATLPVRVGSTWNLGLGFSVQQLVFDESLRRSVPAAKLGKELANQMVAKTENEVRYQAAQLFLSTEKSEALLGTIAANDEKLAALEKTATLLYKNDLGTNLDVKRIKVARTNLQSKKQVLLDAVSYQKDLLMMLCGIREGTELRLIPTEMPLFVQNPEVNRSVEERLLTGAMELTKTKIYAGKATVFPTLKAYASAGVQSPRGNANFFDSEGNWYGAAVVGLRAQSPIFNTFKPKQKQLELEMLKHETDLEQLKKYESIEQKNKAIQLETANNMLSVYDENVQLAKEVRDNLKLQYTAGLLGLSEVLNAQTALLEAESTLLQQRIDVRTAELEVLRVNQALQSL